MGKPEVFPWQMLTQRSVPRDSIRHSGAGRIGVAENHAEYVFLIRSARCTAWKRGGRRRHRM